ncbi:MerR family transcriptional regulator [Nitratireductor sp. GCM10026969]|uniref:MerR family transcriptional regulator n=1 Tax=Nitratireductor sp. GCM10026969 TaxID=3252645 RepID=UPI00361DF8A9
MKISEAAVKCGLSSDTIRFYDKSGMLPEISRGQDGHRHFTPKDVEWLTLLYWLRETGMSLSAMRRFTRLAKQGDDGLAERRQILLEHREELMRQRKALDRCDEVLAIKIASYAATEKDEG